MVYRFLAANNHFMTKRFLIYAIFYVLMLWRLPVLLVAQNKAGLDGNKSLKQYLIDNWSTDNGLPYNNLSHIYQSESGYLWISTFEGLIRFDGKKFDIFTQKDFNAFKTNGVYQVDEDHEGNLWLGSQGSGLLRYKEGKVENITPNFEHPISAVYCSKNGVVWMGTINSGVYSLIDGRHEELRFEGLKKAAIRQIVEDEKGRIWFASEGHGLFVYNHGKVKKYTVEDGLLNNSVVALAVGENNELWIGTTKGLCKFENEVITTIPEFTDVRITAITIDSTQNVWVGARQGVARISKELAKIEWLTSNDGLVGNSVAAITFDKEGSLWICTRRSGLSRIRDGKFVNFSTNVGLSSKNINHILEVAPNEYWIGSDNGTIDLLTDGKISPISLPSQLANARIKHLLKDSKGTIWLASYKGVLKFDGNEITYLSPENGLPEVRARKIYEDSEGNIWIGFRSGGLAKLNQDGEWQVISAQNGLTSEFIMCLAEDKEGQMIIGTNGGGLNVIDKTGKVKVYGANEGLRGSIIFNLYIDNNNITWMATNAGIARFKDGKFSMFNANDGLPINTPFDIMEDNLGFFWLPTSDGIIHLSKANIALYEEGKLSAIPYVLFDRGDGLISKECTPSAEVLMSSNGNLWFPNLGGFARINPNNIPINQLKPQVHIKKFVVDDQEIDIHQPIVLKPGKKRFIIDFTALSFVSPPKMKFKYKLSSMDNDWVSIGEDRQATFTNIPYGEHEFQVIASNNDGVWNEEGATLKFELEPYFYQTPWAYVLGFLLFLGLGILVYKMRVRRIKEHNQELERQVQERTAEINAQKEEILSQRDQLSDSIKKIKTVSEMGQEVTSVLSVEELAQVVYKNINKLMDTDGFGIGLFNPQEHCLEFRGYIEKGKVLSNEVDKLSNKKLLSVYSFDTQTSIFINDLATDSKKYFPDFEFPNHGEAPNSIIYLPLSIDERKIGVITVQSFAKNAYSQENMSFLQTLANYITIALDNAKAYEIIHDKNQDITDSLRYAQTIQHAILPTAEQLNTIFSNYCLLFRPKDIVSGDFYWTAQKGDYTYFAVVDCTGHGVPGAFMSMIGSELLNEIVNANNVIIPATILSKLDYLIYKSLNQKETRNSDGMDVCLCRMEKNSDGTFNINYAGAKRPLFYIEDDVFKELKGDRKHIGGIFQKIGEAKKFTNHELTLNQGDRLYLTTDGFVDQASPDRTKIGTKKLRQFLSEKQNLTLQEQNEFLKEYLLNHQKDAIQRDDITIMGIEL